MIRIRPSGIFETSSSAVHSFIITNRYKPLKDSIFHEFPIIVRPREEGYNYPSYYEPNPREILYTDTDKLGYIICQLKGESFDNDRLMKKVSDKLILVNKSWPDFGYDYDINGNVDENFNNINYHMPIKNRYSHEILVLLQKRLKSKYIFNLSTFPLIHCDARWENISSEFFPKEFWVDFFYYVIIDPQIQILLQKDSHDRAYSINPATHSIFRVLTRKRNRDFYKLRNNGFSWVFFDKATGFKLIVDKFKTEIKKQLPDSLDIKITDICHHNCPMCSENCTPNGSYAKIDEILSALAILQPLEVAIGGGNPLLHPNLHLLYEGCDKLGIVPNITIHCSDIEGFLSEESFFRKRENKPGAIGISVHCIEDIKEVEKFFRKEENKYLARHKSRNYHLILGDISKEEFSLITKHLRFDSSWSNYTNLVLLGKKEIGRGKNFPWKEIPSKEYFEELISNFSPSGLHLIFDTLAIEQIGLDVIKNSPFYLGEEGEASFFIDFANNEYAISSSSEKRLKITNYESMLDILSNNIVNKIIDKIRNNKKLDNREKNHPRLIQFKDKILSQCQDIDNEAIKDLIEWFKKTDQLSRKR
jgi:hypothetical protein